jgi:hypothetical protein
MGSELIIMVGECDCKSHSMGLETPTLHQLVSLKGKINYKWGLGINRRHAYYRIFNTGCKVSIYLSIYYTKDYTNCQYIVKGFICTISFKSRLNM